MIVEFEIVPVLGRSVSGPGALEPRVGTGRRSARHVAGYASASFQEKDPPETRKRFSGARTDARKQIPN